MANSTQIELAETLLALPDEWHWFDLDRRTVECACGLHNLGIATVQGDRIRLASAEKAKRWLASAEGSTGVASSRVD